MQQQFEHQSSRTRAGNTIEGNLIGLDASGLNALGNGIGGTIDLGGNGTSPFTNQGTINVSSGTLGLYGDITLAGLGNFSPFNGALSGVPR